MVSLGIVHGPSSLWRWRKVDKIDEATANNHNLETHENRRQAGKVEGENDEVALHIHGESTHVQPRRKEKKEQQRKRYMLLRLCFSFFGHAILFALSFIPGFGEEETSGHDGGETSKKWLNWWVMELIAPVLLLGVMIIIQTLYIDLEDISEDKQTVKRCKRVNLAMISVSKIVYFAIREAPGCANVKARGVAHAIAFVIDMVGAIYLYRNHSCLEQDNV